MKRLFEWSREIILGYNKQWGSLGTLIAFFLFALSFLANILQVLGSIPESQPKLFEVPIVYLILIVILAIMAISTLTIQLTSFIFSIVKRGPITRLTDIYVIHNRGELYHGGMRHVLFKLGTIQEIMHSIFIDVSNPDPVDIRLYNVGIDVGEGFADGFIDAVDQRGLVQGERGLVDLIDLWCQFDVSGGWGKFVFFPGASLYQGRIEIRSNFLTAAIENPNLDHKSLCKFLEGYIAGILLIFSRVTYPQKTWNVLVQERECGIGSGGVHPCSFDFELHEVQQDDRHLTRL